MLITASVVKYYAFGSQTAMEKRGDGAVRWSSGTIPMDKTFTGQRTESFGLMDYKARYYSPYLNRFLSPDSIVPSTGDITNPNAIGYVANVNHSALTVDYHENQFLEQLNQENKILLEDSNARLPGVTMNPLAIDRYAYRFNNPVRYNDLGDHCPACAAAVLGGVGFMISAPVLITRGNSQSRRPWFLEHCRSGSQGI